MGMSSNGKKKQHRETRGRPRKLKERQERKYNSESTISRFLNKEGNYYLQAWKKGLVRKADIKI